MNTQVLRKALIISALSIVSTQVYAANTDAALDTSTGSDPTTATSTGQFDVNISKGDAVAISGINTAGGIAITGSTSTGDKTGFMSVCTFATTATYTIDINSTETGAGEFSATDGTDQMPFSVLWADGINSWTYTANATTHIAGTSPNRTDPTCGGANNTTVTVTVAEAAFNAVPAGDYVETLDIIITAQ